MIDILKYLETEAPAGKKILLVSHSFYPANTPRSLRTTALAKEFARQGHEVTVLTVKDPAIHEPFAEAHGINIKDLGPLHFRAISISSGTGIRGIAKRALRRAMLLLLEYPDIELMFKVKKALKMESGYNLMITVAVPYPIHWGAAWARKPDHRIADIWVADCGDPYCGLENDSFTPPFYFSYIEKWFSRKADYISIPFEGARAAYFPEFYSKIKVIPQGLSFPEQLPFAEPAQNSIITFAYFGNVKSYVHYALPFIQELNAVENDFRFIVYSRDRAVFEQAVDQSTRKKCVFRDYVAREDLLHSLASVDFLVHFPYQKGTQKSLKLVDYAYLRKPILSYRNDKESSKKLMAFLNRNFEDTMPLEDYRQYEIGKVSAQFLELADPAPCSIAF